MCDLWFRVLLPGYAAPVTVEQLGHLGGEPEFAPPPPDHVTQVRTGLAPRTERSAVEPWWWCKR